MTSPRSNAGLGWRPDPPSFKDWPIRSKLSLEAGYSNTPVDRRAEGHNAPVRDQGAVGSCVGFSATYAVGYLRRTDRDHYSTIYSALQAYYDARVADGMQWKDVDAGAYIRDAMDCLRKIGIAPESKWKYREERFATTPYTSVYREAERWKLGAHYRCDTLDEILIAIDKGFAVVGGFSCYSSLFTADVEATGVVPMPSRRDQFLGGHAVYFDFYDVERKLVRFQNSWSERWGDDGYGYLPFDYVADRNLSDDYWAMQSESPETTPWDD